MVLNDQDALWLPILIQVVVIGVLVFCLNRPSVKSCGCLLEEGRTVQVRRSIEVPVGCLRVSQRAGLEFIAVDEFIFI